MSQQYGFYRNNRMGMNRTWNRDAENSRNQSNVNCSADCGNQTCAIPINAFEYGVNDKYLYFLAEIEIPEGFVLVGNDYNTRLTIDAQDVSALNITQNCRCGNSELCTTTRNCVLLNGLMTYNVTLEDFRAYCPLESVNVVPGTIFNGFGDIYVDKLLACTIQDEFVNEPVYAVLPEKYEEYITTFDGRSIYRCHDAVEFYSLLNNPNVKKTIHVPYRLTIQVCAN